MSEDATAPRHVAVVIVGAGPTGLVAANWLGQEGIETLLLECHTSTSDIPRAITLDDEGLRICQAIRLYEEVSIDMLLDVQARYVSQGRLLAQVAPTGRDNGHPFVSTLHQPTFEATLLHGLERFSCVEVRFQHTVTAIEQDEHSVHLTVQCTGEIDQHITCDYLLACDGGKSMIRQWLDIPMRILSGPFFVSAGRHHERSSQRWLVVDGTESDGEHEPGRATTSQGDHKGAPLQWTNQPPPYHHRGAPLWSPLTITFFCTPARPAVTVPAPGQRRRWEFMLLPGEQEEDVLQQDISELIKQATGQDETAYPLHIMRKAVYTFHAMLAQEWMRGRIFLLGDAAHLMPPFGGQGMNSGLRDASNLCWKLALVLRGQTHADVLATYPLERLPHAAQMIRFSVALGALIMPTSPPIAYARDFFFHTINHIPPLRRVLTEAQVKPRSRYWPQGDHRGTPLPWHGGASQARSSMVGAYPCGRPRTYGGTPLWPSRSARLVGTLLPQPHVTLANGDHVLLDDVLHTHFALLRLTSTPSTAYNTSLNSLVWQHWEVRFVCIVPRGLVIADEAMDGSITAPFVVRDDENVLNSRLFHDNDALCLLVRPDRYIMGAFLIQNSRAFEQSLIELLQPTVRPAAGGRVHPGA